MESPLAVVKERFGDKAKLVAEVEKLAGQDLWVARTSKDKGLAHVSNAKLLRLHRIFTQVKEQFGTRDKLIAAILELEKRTKDEGYKSRISQYPVPRLFDMYRSLQKRTGAPQPKAAEEPKKARPAKKAAAKATADDVEKPAKKPARKTSRAKSESK